MRQKSFFVQLLKNFMLTLFVPIISVLLIYIYAEHSIDTQITESSKKSLNQFFSAIDTTVEEMRDICISLLNNNQCSLYAYYTQYKPQKTAYQSKVLSDALANASQPKYADIFVYFPIDGRIVSGMHASTGAAHYFNSFYKSFYNVIGLIDKSAEDWLRFEKVLAYSSSAPSLGILQRHGQKNLCVMASSKSQYNALSANWVAAVVLNESYLNRLIGSDQLDEDIHFMIFSENKQLLISSNSQWESLSIENAASSASELTVQIDGKAYRLMARRSENLKGYYAIAIPQDYYARRLRTLRITCWLSIAITISLSILVAWRNSVRSWNPFEALYIKLQEQNDHAGICHAENELEFIELLFQKEKNEKLALLGKAGTGVLLQKEKVLQALLLGSVKDQNEIHNLLERNELHFNRPYFYVCLVRLEPREGKAPDAFASEHTLRGLFKTVSKQDYEWYVARMAEMEYGLILNSSEIIDESQLIQMLKEKYHLLECSIDVAVTTGMSLCKESVYALSASFEEAEIAMSYSFFTGAGEFICYAAVQKSEFDYTPFLEHNLSSMVMHYIASGGADSSPEAFTAQILDTYGITRSSSIEIVNCFRYEMLNALYKSMVSYQYTHAERYSFLACILSDQHMQEFQCHIAQILSELCLKHLKSEAQKDVCSQARKYIQTHFDHPQMSLESIAECVGCSPSYLSRTFKQKYGSSIVTYIAEIRISKAKALLETTDLSITDISAQVGYLSSNALIKSFKKMEGTTPAAYRSLKHGETDAS